MWCLRTTSLCHDKSPQGSKKRTVLNGQCSDWGAISAGMLQGSILGPLFFLVYINDLTVGLKCNAKHFADDTSLFTVVPASNMAANDIDP